MNEKVNVNLPTVSIIVVNWNGKKWLKDCFESLENLNYPKDKYEVIMVDNASSDDSVEFTRKNFPWIKILKLDKNYGFSEGNNKGVKVSKGEYLAFLNNDTIVDKNWLSELIKCVIKNPKAICSSITLDYYNKEKIAFNVIKKSMFGLDISIDAGRNYSTQNLSQQNISYPIGAGMLIRKDTFTLLGGFDSSYFMYGEDASLGWKAWLFRYNVVVVPSSIYWHVSRASSGGGGRSPFYIYNLWRNCMINIVKYPEIQNAIKMFLLFSMVISVGSSFLFIIKGQFALIFAIIKAYFSLIKILPYVLKERRAIQSKRKISDNELYKIGIFMPFGESIRETILFVKKLDLTPQNSVNKK